MHDNLSSPQSWKDSLSKFLVEADNVSDKVPVLSTVTNAVGLLGKGIMTVIRKVLGKKPSTLKNTYVQHIEDKSVLRCVTLMVPVLGNLTVGVYDIYKHHNQRMQLLNAARLGDIKTLKELMQAGIDVNTRNYDDSTPLMLAAEGGHVDLVESLLDAGADCTVKSHGNTALMLAVKGGHKEVVEHLLAPSASTINACNYQGNTALLLGASEGHREIVEMLLGAGADIEARNGSGETALTAAAKNQHPEIVRQLIQAGAAETQRGVWPIVAQDQEEGLIQRDRSYSLSNRLHLRVNRADMTVEKAKEHLNILASQLAYYQKQLHGNFHSLRLHVTYDNEEGSDFGGLSREYISQIFKNLLLEPSPFPFFEQMENGLYEPMDKNGKMTAQDLQVCRDTGMILAALSSGFPDHMMVKIGSVFSERFYCHLLALYKYGQDHPGVLEKDFSAMDFEEQSKLVLNLFEQDPYTFSLQKLHHLLDQTTWKESELDALLEFLALDMINGNEESIDPDLAKLLGKFIQNPNCLGLLKMHEAFELESENKVYTRKDLHEALKTALAGNQAKVLIKEKFVQELVDTYTSTCIPLIAIVQGFSHVNKKEIEPFLKEFQVDPKAASQALSKKIQGEPFSHQAFVELLKRTISENAAVNQKIKWLTEWCEHGINKVKGTAATEEQMKAMLRCITGFEEISDKIRFKFEEPVEGLTVFKTCFSSVRLGRGLLQQTDKRKFIETWNEHVDIALKQGFGIK